MIGLSELLGYKNNTVVKHFCSHHPNFSEPEGQALFADLLAWMWLNVHRAKQGKKTYLFGPLLILDELWHTFILHTRDYVDFSMRYFDCYFHHDVEPSGQEHVMEEVELTDYLQDCFAYLGSEWVSRRFATALAETNNFYQL
ncbi:hypothetical protein [Legionella sp. PC997]|uniref:hypothetical protein n=1 Tax=Legionella sp. PC997 TaxID=2755562 RepID=UPI0015FC8F0F|nr:hypothetical protein [Legionella sp. PC997]QMT61252.1 hypothetical protein HBNCFIEN_02647 [Legionella sp. PC997]